MTVFSSARRVALLSFAGSLAALTAWQGVGLGEDTPRLNIESSSNVARTESKPAPVVAKKPEQLVGDAPLREQLDLSKLVLENGRFVVKVGDETAVLTLDPDIQAAADAVLAKAQAPYGAVVVTATDGRILAFAGRSNADGREHNYDLPSQVWAPAASVFKVVTAAALVDAGVSPSQEVCVHGGVRSVEASNLRDDPKRDTLCASLRYGVAQSQNAIIAKLAHRHLNPRALQRVARRFGFGSAPQFALPAEQARAEIPTDDLDFARTAAGFWNTEISPLTGVLLANTIASGGLRVTPRIVESMIDSKGHERPVIGLAPKRVLSRDTARQITDMMTETTETGTARRAFRDRRGARFLREVKVAGKTGSLARAKPSYLGYSWFVGFAPASSPEVAISVLLANDIKWHLKAHTAARLVLQTAL